MAKNGSKFVLTYYNLHKVAVRWDYIGMIEEAMQVVSLKSSEIHAVPFIIILISDFIAMI